MGILIFIVMGILIKIVMQKKSCKLKFNHNNDIMLDSNTIFAIILLNSKKLFKTIWKSNASFIIAILLLYFFSFIFSLEFKKASQGVNIKESQLARNNIYKIKEYCNLNSIVAISTFENQTKESYFSNACFGGLPFRLTTAVQV